MKKLLILIFLISNCAYPVEDRYEAVENFNDNSSGDEEQSPTSLDNLIANKIPKKIITFNILRTNEDQRY